MHSSVNSANQPSFHFVLTGFTVKGVDHMATKDSYGIIFASSSKYTASSFHVIEDCAFVSIMAPSNFQQQILASFNCLVSCTNIFYDMEN